MLALEACVNQNSSLREDQDSYRVALDFKSFEDAIPLPYINSPFETLYKHFTPQARGGKGKQNLCDKQDSWHG